MEPTKHRAVQAVYSAQPTIEGAGVHLRRAFGNAEAPRFDPFLLLDDFRSDNPLEYLPGFPWHPHRGIETVSYVLDGHVEHGDSMGNRGVIGPGDVQWMTAGSGIIHQEMPKPGKAKRMAGFQLWVNLPRDQKMRDPRYQEIGRSAIPDVALSKGVSARVVAGRLGAKEGPVRDITARPEFLDLSLDPGASFVHAIPGGHTAFAYVIEGRGRFEGPEGELVDSGTLVHFGDGERVSIKAESRPLRFFLVSGKPTGDPVAWWGPIVMSTRKDIEVALTELQEGTFIKQRGTPGALSATAPTDARSPDPSGYAGGSDPGASTPRK